MKISEIAKMAGVSNAAVSRYLNGGSLSEQKKEQIKRIIDETGYQPNIVAQMLRTKQTRNVGVIVPRISSESVSKMTEGIAKVLTDKNYMFLLGVTRNNEEKELEYLKMMQRNHLAGAILMGTIFTSKHEEILKTSKIPIVVLGQEHLSAPSVYHDDFHAMKDLTELMLKKGRRKIIYMGVTEKDIAVGLHRFQGVQAAIEAFGESVELIKINADFFLETGYRRMQEALANGVKADGVLCATDSLAMGAMQALTENGILVPNQVSVAGIGDSDMGNLINPKLTTVHFHYEESGAEAARLLISTLEESEATCLIKKTMLSYELIERESL